jgi:hypothetical protein
MSLSKGLVAIVDDEDYEYLSQWKWSTWMSGRKPYAGRYQGRKLVLMHRVINRTPEGVYTDHIDCDTLNNRRSNLRDATARQNVMNKLGKIGGTSRFKGVWFDWRQKGSKQWRTAIRLNGKLQYLGWFATEEEAGAAYAAAARLHFGEFANIRKGVAA